MTKADIVNEITVRTGVDKAAVQQVVERFMEVVKNAMVSDRNVYLRGFGSLIVKKRAQKVARNISKSTSITIPERYIPAFKPSKTFLNRVKSSVKRA